MVGTRRSRLAELRRSTTDANDTGSVVRIAIGPVGFLTNPSQLRRDMWGELGFAGAVLHDDSEVGGNRVEAN